MSLPSHYKAEGQARGETCLICQTLTRGPTVAVHLGFGEYVFLCRGHASEEFRRKRNGRDFALSILKASKSAGRLTKRRRQALRRIFDELNDDAPAVDPAVRRPGSYAWPKTRRCVEEACRKGVVSIAKLMDAVHANLGKAALKKVNAPSERTVRRWRQERRWAGSASEPPSAGRRG